MGTNWLILIILLTILVICICVFIKCITLIKCIDALERNINTIKYQIDDVLDYINTVNQNMVNTYGLLSRMKDKNK